MIPGTHAERVRTPSLPRVRADWIGRDRKGREGKFLAHLFRQVTDYLWLRVLVAFDLQHHFCNARVNDAGRAKP